MNPHADFVNHRRRLHLTSNPRAGEIVTCLVATGPAIERLAWRLLRELLEDVKFRQEPFDLGVPQQVATARAEELAPPLKNLPHHIASLVWQGSTPKKDLVADR